MPTKRCILPDYFESSADTIHSSEGTWWNFSAKSPSYIKSEPLEDNNDKWKYKEIDEWSPTDVIFWILHVAYELGERNPAALPLENFREIDGRLLRNMCVEEWRHRMPEYCDQLYQQLQVKLAASREGESETMWPFSPPRSPIILTNLDAQPPTHHVIRAPDQALSLLTISDTKSFLQPSERSSVSANNHFDHSDSEFQYRNPLSDTTSFLHPSERYSVSANNHFDHSDSEFQCRNSLSADHEYENDSDSSVEAEKPNVREKRPVGRPRRNPVKEKSHRKVGRVWEFIRDLLMDPKYNPSLMRWVNREEGLFRFENSDQVAKLWGEKRGNTNMNFEKFSRSVRHNYKKQYLLPMKNQRLVYKFGPMSYGWQQESSYRR